MIDSAFSPIFTSLYALRLRLLKFFFFYLSFLSSFSLSLPACPFTKKKSPPLRPEMRPFKLTALLLPFLYFHLTTAHLTPYIQTCDTNHLFSNPLIIPAPCIGIVCSTLTITGCPTPSPLLQCVGTVYSIITRDRNS